MRSFDSGRMDVALSAAIQSLRTVLGIKFVCFLISLPALLFAETTKKPLSPKDVHHAYSDKYLLSEWVTLTTVSSLFAVLEELGMNAALLHKLADTVQCKSVTVRLSATENCVFDRKEKRVVSGNKHTNEGFSGPWTSKVIHKIDEWFYKFDYAVELCVFAGPYDASTKTVLQSRTTGKYEIVRESDQIPRPTNIVRDPIDMNITWLFQQVRNCEVVFAIDRAREACRTPRRNPEIDAALEFSRRLYDFARKVEKYFRSDIIPIHLLSDLDMGSVSARSIFVPVVPVFDGRVVRNAAKKQLAVGFTKGLGNVKAMMSFGSASALALGAGGPEQPAAAAGENGGAVFGFSQSFREQPFSVVMPFEDLSAMLQQHRGTLRRKLADLEFAMPTSEKLVTTLEVRLVILAAHTQALLQSWQDCVDYIEGILRDQLIAAIGKEVQPEDFAEYMRFHNRRVFLPEFAPRKFCYAVRRPNHYPEGILSLETADDREIETFCKVSPIGKPMRFAINAATDVSFLGHTYFHGYVSHKFSNREAPKISLHARASQFSSFIVLVGRIIGPTMFDPKYGVILKDKDDLKIPLNFETIPSAKEFKESISSISEEQQRFAKAFRSMQLESTLFGVCVVQIKPQLEKLLGLPEDGLTKEIRLTSDLLEIMTKYQIPSDLLSFDGAASASPKERVTVVKNYVAVIYAMIEHLKNGTLADVAMQAVVEDRLEQNEEDDASSCEVDDEREQCMNIIQQRKRDIEQLDRDIANLAAIFDEVNCMVAMQGETVDSVVTAESIVPACSGLSLRKAAPMAKSLGSKRSAAPSTPSAASTACATTTTDSNNTNKAKPDGKPSPAKPEGQNGNSAPAEEVELPECESAKDIMGVPKEIDAMLEKYDEKGRVCPVIINVSNEWSKRAQLALLAAPTQFLLDVQAQGTERNAAFDLLDALTKSGAMPLEDVSLHCVLAYTTCFDQTLMDAMVKENVNPIEAVEQKEFIVASAIHNVDVASLIEPSHLARVAAHSGAKLMLSRVRPT